LDVAQRSDHGGEVTRQGRPRRGGVRCRIDDRGDIAFEPAHNGPLLGIAKSRFPDCDNLRYRYRQQWPYLRQPMRFLLDGRGSSRLSGKSDQKFIAESEKGIA
jgi:hypothetical protein